MPFVLGKIHLTWKTVAKLTKEYRNEGYSSKLLNLYFLWRFFNFANYKKAETRVPVLVLVIYIYLVDEPY